jgi:hypothetical protein
MKMGLALGFSGHMCFELIQPLDDKPSVYRDVINKLFTKPNDEITASAMDPGAVSKASRSPRR